MAKLLTRRLITEFIHVRVSRFCPLADLSFSRCSNSRYSKNGTSDPHSEDTCSETQRNECNTQTQGHGFKTQANTDSNTENVNNLQDLNSKPKIKSTQQFLLDKRKRRSLSPSERLAAMLPEDHEVSEESDNKNPQNETFSHPGETDGTNSQSSVHKKSDFLKYRFKSRAKVQPASRLANIIPEDYWKSLDDSETKQIVDDLDDNADTDFKNKKDS